MKEFLVEQMKLYAPPEKDTTAKLFKVVTTGKKKLLSINGVAFIGRAPQYAELEVDKQL